MCQNKLDRVHFFSGVLQEYDLINIIRPSPIGLKASKTKVLKLIHLSRADLELNPPFTEINGKTPIKTEQVT